MISSVDAGASAASLPLVVTPAVASAAASSNSRSKAKNSRSKRQGGGVGAPNKRNKKKSEPLETEEQRLARLMDEKRQEINKVKEYIAMVKELNRLVRDDGGENLTTLRAFFSVMNDIYEEVANEVILEAFKKVSTDDIDLHRDIAYALPPNVDVDIYGQDFSSYAPESFQCDQGCGRQIAANRYAPHLEKCSNLSTARVGSSRRTRANEVNYEEPPDRTRPFPLIFYPEHNLKWCILSHS
jgi:hypothetical protein